MAEENVKPATSGSNADIVKAMSSAAPTVRYAKSVPVALPTGPELKRIRTCLKTRPAKADKTAMYGTWAASAAAIIGALKSAIAANLSLSADWISVALVCVASTAAFIAWRKYEDALAATDPHLNEALEDVDRLIAETAGITAEVEHRLAVRIASVATPCARVSDGAPRHEVKLGQYRIGGKVISANRKHMSNIGRKGGAARAAKDVEKDEQ